MEDVGFQVKTEEPQAVEAPSIAPNEVQVKQEFSSVRESEGEEEELVQTESEEDSAQSREALNEKIHERIKQLLGCNYSKIKSEKEEESKSKASVRSGRGKWHYTCDQKYGFNVSYSNGDTIISMGQVFIIQTPKMSISSKYRGYPIPVIEPPSNQHLVFEDSELSRASRFRAHENFSHSSVSRSYQSSSGFAGELSHEARASDEVEEDDFVIIESQSSPPAECFTTRGPIFCVHSYLTKAESERQRGLAIQEGLKYEEEYLSHKIKLRVVNA